MLSCVITLGELEFLLAVEKIRPIFHNILLVRTFQFPQTKPPLTLSQAGAFAAFSVDLLIYPLDTLKTRIQSPNYSKTYLDASQKINPRLLYRGLYQGLGSVILATIPSSGAFFTTYEATKSGLNRLNPVHNSVPLIPAPVLHAIASSLAESVSCLILTPAEVLKQNAQMVQVPQQSSASNKPATANATLLALRQFQKRPSQLFRGYTALVSRNLPFTAMQFPMFEGLKTRLLEWRRESLERSGEERSSFLGRLGSMEVKLSLLETGCITAVSAGSAGALAAVVTTPVDVVKTRIMLAAGQDDGKAVVGNKGQWAVAKEVMRTDGVKGLMRGATLRGVWTAFGSGLYLGVYESARVLLEERRKKADDGPGAG
ncbi:MAG: hypothetical protein M1814_003695 [Vezdaea aestivalis]|nr:MAG: hypothetical protein M1814_003695 [Vezdaea aestivalis]